MAKVSIINTFIQLDRSARHKFNFINHSSQQVRHTAAAAAAAAAGAVFDYQNNGLFRD